MAQMSWRFWAALGVALFAVGLVVLLPAAMARAQTGEPAVRWPEAARPGEIVTASSGAETKLDPLLRSPVEVAGRMGSDEITYVAIKSSGPIDLTGLAEKAVSTRWPLGQVVTLARIQLRHLPKVAAIDEVIFVEDAANAEVTTDEVVPPGIQVGPDIQAQRRRLAELRRNEVPFSEAPPLVALSAESRSARVAVEPLAREGGAAPDGWYDVVAGHGSAKAWAKGWRGEGVRVGISDSGVDFAVPELAGTWAVIEDDASPYAGWPQALDAQGLYLWVQDVQLGSTNAAVGAGGVVSATQISRATRDFEGVQGNYGTACFARVLQGDQLDEEPSCDYKVPWVSRSGNYRFAVHPDPYLVSLYGERPGVLVVDRGSSGRYDTVYVDLDNDHDFTDEKPLTKEDPLAYRDMDGDGWADLSGGLLYWIADGVNPPPGAYLFEGLVPTPGRGEVVAFIGPWGGSHGTMCASNIAGQGVVPVPEGINLRFRDLPGDGRPFPVNVGAAPGAAVVGIRRGGLLVTEATYIYAAYGHDVDRPGDELQILSNSYGYRDVINEGWDNTSRLVDYLNIVNPNLTYLFSSGNGGPGYGSIRGAHPHSGLKVAASTQTGSTGYDSITDTAQITWGDIISFSSSGPASDGTTGPMVAADGAYASGSTVLNSPLDGRLTVRTWGGTSRSTPVAAGNLALVYQAFKERHGRWPTFDEARSLLMAGATLNGYDTFMAGAGVIDGGVSAAIAGGVDGIYAYPPRLIPGGYRGAEFGSFPKVLSPGEERSIVLTLNNASERDITVHLAAQTSRRIGSHEFAWTSVTRTLESTSFSEVPDYVIPIPEEEIPAGTELMAVRLLMPLEDTDVGLNYNYSGDNLWYLRVYQHTDIDGDGLLWEDRDRDGTVDKKILTTVHQIDGIRDVDWSQTEIDRWEYARFGQDTRPNNNEVVWVHHPLERWSDGIYIGLQHGSRPAVAVTTTMRFRLDFYRYEDWDWLTFDKDDVTVPAGNAASVTVNVNVPTDAPYGYVQGIVAASYEWEAEMALPPAPRREIYLPVAHNGEGPSGVVSWMAEGVSGRGSRGYRLSAISYQSEGRRLNVPVQLNVAATFGSGSLELVPAVGGGSMAHDVDLPYPNGLVRAANRWNYGKESGDWRYFLVDVPEAQPPGTRLVVRSSWEDGKVPGAEGEQLPRSDIDTLIYAPASDRWSDPSHPDNAEINLADPAFFGPHTTELAGGSANKNTRGGIWEFDTATGDYEEWVTAGIAEGLHLIIAHNTLISGDRFEVPFSMSLDSAQLAPDKITGTGPEAACHPAMFKPTFALEGLTSAGYGLSPVEEFKDAPVRQDDSGNPLTASWRRTFTVQHGSLIDLVLDGVEGDDLDLFLYRDANGDGNPQTNEQLASSTSPEDEEAISYRMPEDGQYIVTVHGWDVPAGDSTFDLTMTVIQGTGVQVQGLPAGPVTAGEEVAFEVCYDELPPDSPGRYVGEAVFGPPTLPMLFQVPVEVVVGE